MFFVCVCVCVKQPNGHVVFNPANDLESYDTTSLYKVIKRTRDVQSGFFPPILKMPKMMDNLKFLYFKKVMHTCMYRCHDGVSNITKLNLTSLLFPSSLKLSKHVLKITIMLSVCVKSVPTGDNMFCPRVCRSVPLPTRRRGLMSWVYKHHFFCVFWLIPNQFQRYHHLQFCSLTSHLCSSHPPVVL